MRDSSRYTLMIKDTPLINFIDYQGRLEVTRVLYNNSNLLPSSLQSGMLESLYDWLLSRGYGPDRENLYFSRGVSLEDSYWVRRLSLSDRFSDVLELLDADSEHENFEKFDRGKILDSFNGSKMFDGGLWVGYGNKGLDSFMNKLSYDILSSTKIHNVPYVVGNGKVLVRKPIGTNIFLDGKAVPDDNVSLMQKLLLVELRCFNRRRTSDGTNTGIGFIPDFSYGLSVGNPRMCAEDTYSFIKSMCTVEMCGNISAGITTGSISQILASCESSTGVSTDTTRVTEYFRQLSLMLNGR